MADRPASERTEQPTAERLRKARQEGQIPQSQELPSALLLAAIVIALATTAAGLGRWFHQEVSDGFSLAMLGNVQGGGLTAILAAKTGSALWAMLPFLAAAAGASVLGSVLVSGWSVSPAAVRLKWERLSPMSGMKQIISTRSLGHLAASVLKLAILVVLCTIYLGDKMDLLMALASASPAGSLAVALDLVLGLLVRITVALAVIAVADVLFQRWQYKRGLRMTRDEVKEERRTHEGSPLVRARRRSLHLALVNKRMLRKVPEADVVLVNPTHVAVALKYDSKTMPAPVLLAKGADLLCERIKELAREHGVPVVEKPELARTLYAGVEVGQTIPEALYVAVAEILAMIYRMRKTRA
jgi:flagellar biosynthetic protein FlhB